MDEINLLDEKNYEKLEQISEVINNLCFNAGSEIMKYYGISSYKVKSDGSPVTKADIEANKIIQEGLLNNFKNIPVISEEGLLSCDGDLFFLVDPLDGTKEFLEENGEFTVNIALISRGIPILGSIFLPQKNLMYWTNGKESYSKINKKKKIIKVSEINRKYYKIEVSRSHMDKKTEKFVELLTPLKINAAGSSLKICNISNGNSDLYPRFNNVFAWDIAAGHAILKNAGGEIFKLNGEILTYSNSNLLIESFLAFSKKTLPEEIFKSVKKIR